MNLLTYQKEIDHYKELAENTIEDNPAALQKKTELLVKAMKLIGEVAAEYAWWYKTLHSKRIHEYNLAYKAASSPKGINAELEIEEYRNKEDKAYALMHKYRNDFSSTQEEIHMLKQKMKVNFADGTVGSRWGG